MGLCLPSLDSSPLHPWTPPRPHGAPWLPPASPLWHTIQACPPGSYFLGDRMVYPKGRNPLKVDFQTTTNWSEDNSVGVGGKETFLGFQLVRLLLDIRNPNPGSGISDTCSSPTLYPDELSKGKNTLADREIWDPESCPAWRGSRSRCQVVGFQFRLQGMPAKLKNMCSKTCMPAWGWSCNGGRSLVSVILP